MVHKRPEPEGQPWVRQVYVHILHSDLVWSSMVWCSYHFWYAQYKKWNHTCLGMKFIPLFLLCIAQVAYRKLQIAVVYEQNLQLPVSSWKILPTCQIYLVKWRIYLQFNSLVWNSLTLGPIIHNECQHYTEYCNTYISAYILLPCILS